MSVVHDRRSRMSTSTVHPAMKKDGGGTANWGSALDPATMYDPQGHNVSKVMMTAAPVMYASQPMVAQPMAYSVTDAQHFPTLGGSASTVGATYWGPGMTGVAVPATLQDQLAAQNRQGVIYDASHPRNAFARQPRVSTVVAAESGQTQPALAIDWSQAGGHVMQQTMLHVAANPGLLGPAPTQGAYPATPLQVLRAQPAPMPIQPRLVMQSYPSQPQFSKNPHLTQGRGR